MSTRPPAGGDRSEGDAVDVEGTGTTGERPAVRLVEFLGAHFGPAHRVAFEMCRQDLRDGRRLTHLAQYTGGVCDFTLDLTGDPTGDPASYRPLETYQDAGRNIAHDMADLDEELQPVQSGDLIRLVLQADQATIFSFSVLRNRFLVGLVPTPPADSGRSLAPQVPVVRAADVAISELANRLRGSVSQRPTDYGGWLWLGERYLAEGYTSHLVHQSLPSQPEEPVQSPPEEPAQSPSAGPDDDVQRQLERCRRALDVEDLHFVAICRHGTVSLSVDLLDDDRLSPFFGAITVEQRRRFYHGFGTRVEARLRALLRSVYPAIGRRLSRAVFDVEQGALYCYPLGPGEYLLGVTLDQNRVGLADDKAARLARDLRG
ncbi:hypothetical protein GCM10027290_08520 [Micromonospora sonneratiae]|uniref:SUKH-3 immunity protein n=1 Tax=Micromonospora sonneratiae TaxID=1184706 RepID=A0ABW3YCL2_9ACTN